MNFVELESPMLHAKFQDHRTSGFSNIWAWPPSWSCDLDRLSPFPRRLHIKFGLIGHAVSVEKMFEIVDDHNDDDNAGASVYYKLTV